MRRNTKFVLGGAAGLIVVACIVAVTLAVSLNAEIQFLEESKTTFEILSEIRALMKDPDAVQTPIQAYIIPSVDAHQSEYISASDQRIRYVSSFTGSVATVIITDEHAVLWTDSRYHIQAEEELDLEFWQLMKSGNPGVPTFQEWLTQTLPPNSIVGIDPFLIISSSFESLSSSLSAAGHTLKSISTNLVDEVWTDKPEVEINEIVPLAIQYSGRRIADKLEDVRRELRTLGAETHMVIALDHIAWLLNLRGLDIQNNPVFFAYVIITKIELHLYVLDESRITTCIKNHFQEEGVADEIKVFEYNLALAGLAEIIATTSGKVLLSSTNQAIFETVPVSRRLTRASPIVLLKVVKNEVEANGMRNANIRDGVAVIRYIYWLNKTIGKETITELSGAERLRGFRAEQENYRGLSFTAISAVGGNAAKVHYSPTEDNAREITRDEIYLIDSGGQYWDGTTDTTRTLHFGVPSDFERETFTRVLKGFISLGSATFPVKAPFSFFDAMARRALWDVGLNYGHGTGHGIGAYLNVHEYPPLISSTTNEPGMVENMFTSNEPGYYEEGQFGIRIEDVVQAVKAKSTPEISNFNGVGALQFYHITMVPIQLSLIKVELLSKQEVTWLNEYHERIYKSTVDLLVAQEDTDAGVWLREQTQPIAYIP